MILKLAMRNLISAGWPTWVNAFGLSLAFVVMVWGQGLYEGISQHRSGLKIRFEFGGGQYHHPNYEADDASSLQEAHGPLTRQLQSLIENSRATSILVSSGTVYLQGQPQQVIFKGIDPDQTILELPSKFLVHEGGPTPVMMGEDMAKSLSLDEGDNVMIGWRSAAGEFVARNMRVARVMDTGLESIDRGQIWLALKDLQEMTSSPRHATLVVVASGFPEPFRPSWPYMSQADLLKDIQRSIWLELQLFFSIILALAALAILAVFKTQAVSISRRKKEIGALLALGMRRRDVARMFTLEGGLSGLLAAVLGAVYGIPLLAWSAMEGISSGGALLYPVYSMKLIVVAGLAVLLAAGLVSYLPTMTIIRCNPAEALRGKAL